MRTHSSKDIDSALIQLRYAESDYYSCDAQNRDAKVNALEALGRALRKASNLAQLELGILNAEPAEIAPRKLVTLRIVR
jgi:hypothetical protein